MSKLPISEEHLLNFFNDSQKVNTLYGPARDENINPVDKMSQVSFTKKMINMYCTHNSQYTFNLSDLKTIFFNDGRYPACLDDVLIDMLRNGEILALNKYLESSPKSWKMWLIEVFIRKPVTWSLTKIKNLLFGSNNLNDTYVHLEVVKSNAKEFLSLIPDKYKDKVLSVNDVLEIMKENFPVLSAENGVLLMQCLCLENKADLRTDKVGNNHVVKLIKFYRYEVKPITDLDVSIFSVKEVEKILEKNVANLEDSVQEQIDKAKASMKICHTQLAKTYLRKKHEVEKRIEKNANALHYVQVLLERLHHSQTGSNVADALANVQEKLEWWHPFQTDTDIIDSCSDTLSTMKAGFSNLDASSVCDLMLEICAIFDTREEIQQPQLQSETEDDANIDKELGQLMKEESTDTSRVVSMEDLRAVLPGVPKQTPKIALETKHECMKAS